MSHRFITGCIAAGLALIGMTGLTAYAAPPTAPAANGNKPSSTIVQIAEADADLSTLVKALSATNLVGTLEGAGPFTVFAPTNEAFGKLPSGLLDYLLANPAVLKTVLLYHVAPGADMLTPSSITTVEGEPVFPSFDFGTWGASFRVNESYIVGKPIKASNGVIYVIDSVLIPQFR